MPTPAQRSRIGRIGGLTLHATSDSYAIAARARAGLDARFRRDVIEHAANAGQAELTEAEIDRRVVLSRKLHFTRMAAKRACVQNKAA
jgi:hypothetical protein